MNLYRLCRLHNSDFYSDSTCFNPLDEVCFIVIYLTLSLSLTHKTRCRKIVPKQNKESTTSFCNLMVTSLSTTPFSTLPAVSLSKQKKRKMKTSLSLLQYIPSSASKSSSLCQASSSNRNDV